MLFFSRIFDFQTNDVQDVEKRLSRRYTPGRRFRLEASLRHGSREIPAKVHDLSAGGLAVVVPSGGAPSTGADVSVTLSLDKNRLETRAQAAHAQPAADGDRVGLSLLFDDFVTRKAYLQLLQPVVLGSTLAPVDPERVHQDEPQFHKLVYRGDEGAVLSVWLAKSLGTPLHSFEFRMRDCFVRADASVGVLEVFLREQMEATHKGKITTPVFDMSGGASEEIRRLFRWIVPNLPESIPDDVRTFLRQVAG